MFDNWRMRARREIYMQLIFDYFIRFLKKNVAF